MPPGELLAEEPGGSSGTTVIPAPECSILYFAAAPSCWGYGGRAAARGDPPVVEDHGGVGQLPAHDEPAVAVDLDVERIAILSPGLTPRATEHLRRKMGRSSPYPLTILTLVFAVNVTQNALLPAVFPLIKVEFRLSDTALGLLGSSFLFLASAGALPFAVMADRYSRTTIISWALVAWGALILFMGTAGSYARLFVGRALLGLTDPAEQPTSYSLLTDYYRVEERGRVFAVWNIGQLGGLLLVPIAGAMADVWGWRAAFYLFSIPGFLLALAVWRLPEPERGAQDRLFEQRRRAGQTAMEGPVAVPDPSTVDGHRPPSARLDLSRASIKEGLLGYIPILRIATVRVALLSIGLTSFLTRGLGVWLAIFFVRYQDMSIAQATSSVALMALGALIGTLSAGYIGDELEARGYRSGRIRLAGSSSILSAVFLVAAFSTDHTPTMLLLFFVGAVLVFPPGPLLQACVADVVDPGLRGRGASLDTLMQTVAGSLSVLVFGILSDAFGLRTTVLSIVPSVAIGGLVVLFIGARFMPRDVDRMRARLLEDEGPVDPADVVVAPPAQPV